MAGVDPTPHLSVVVPTYRGDDWICDCLDSLAAQTLPRDRFEVLLVQNGPVTRTAEIVAAWLAEHPGFRLTLLRSEKPGVSAARNLGVDESRADYVTFVDDDDRLAPAMLAALARIAAPDVIGSVLVGDVVDGDYTEVDFDNYYSRALFPFQGREAKPSELPDMLSPTWAKVVPTAIAREVRFDEALFKGQDTVFWVSVASSRKLRQVVAGDGTGAAYLRNKRSGSLRQFDSKPTWEHNVEARAKVLSALATIPIDDPEIETVRGALYRAVFRSDVRAYLREHPEDRTRVLAALRDLGVSDIPWRHLNLDLAGRFAVVGLLGTTGAEMSTRLLERGAVVDVLTYSTSDEEFELADAEQLIGHSFPVTGPADVTWEIVTQLAQAADEVVERVESARNVPYATLYSSSAGPLEHLVAAALKLKRPDWPWIADEVGFDGPGADGLVGKDPLARQLCALLSERGVRATSPRTMGALARQLVAVFADETLPGRRPMDVTADAELADGVELVFLGVDTRAAEAFADHGSSADVVILPLPGQDAAAALEPITALVGDVSAIVVPGVSWQAAELMIGPLRETLASLRRDRDGLAAVRSISRSPLEHIAAAVVKLSASEVRWTAELLSPTEAGDWDEAGEQMRSALLEAVAAAGHPVEGAPTRLEPFAAWIAEVAADEVVDSSRDDRCPRRQLDGVEATTRPRISVVLPTYMGDEWIVGCLDALAAQTLDRHEFEVIVIANGPRTRTPEIVEEWSAARPDLGLRLIVADRAGVSHARNLGLDTARGEYATFVDDDDLVGPRMLEVLLAKARPGVIPMAAVGLFSDDVTAVEFTNWYTDPLLPHLVTGANNTTLYPTLTGPWAKLVPVELARRVRFREDLHVGEDRVFWVDVFAAEKLQLVFAAWAADAAYLYRQRADSAMGRGVDKSWERFALPWVDAASALLGVEAQRQETAELRHIALSYMFGNFLRTYVAAHPADAGRCGRLLAARGLSIPGVPWRPMFTRAAREVAFVGTTPARDADGRHLVERVAASAAYAVDIVAYQAGSDSGTSLEEHAGAAGVPVDSVIGTVGPAALTWSDFGVLATQVGAELEKQEATKSGGYLVAHSASASPVEHLLAALFKLARPGVEWTAEITRGKRRQHILGADTLVEGDPWFQVLGAGLVEAGYPVEEVPEQMDRFAEMVTLGLADRIIVDSADHAEEILARCPVQQIAARARSLMTAIDEREQVVA